MTDARVAYLLKKFPRLSETFVLGEMLAQQDLGRRLYVFSRRPPDDEPRHPRLAELDVQVEIVPRARELNPWAELFGSDGPLLLDALRRIASDPSLTRHTRFSEVLAEAIHLRKRVAELGIEHLHVHFATDAAVCAAILRELGGPSYSVTAHAKDIYRQTVDPAVLDRILRGSAFTVTVCDANVRHVSELVSPEGAKNLRRLYNGVDLDEFELVTEGRLPAQVLAVGRLVEKKGFDIVLEAAARLGETRPEIEFVVAGTGDQEEALRARADELGLGARLRFTGAVDQDAVRRMMARSTLLVLPCRIGQDGNRDALPTVLLEALACGLPCISTPVSGVGEILDGVGDIVPCEDPGAVAGAIVRLLDDPVERARRAVCGRARAEELFDRKKNARVLFDWFEEALGSRSAPCESPT